METKGQLQWGKVNKKIKSKKSYVHKANLANRVVSREIGFYFSISW